MALYKCAGRVGKWFCNKDGSWAAGKNPLFLSLAVDLWMSSRKNIFP